MLQNPERLSVESFQPQSFPLKLHKLWLIVVYLIFLGICGYAAFTLWAILTDNFGTFHNTTDVADVDSDGDLDVIVHNVRQESEFTAFGGARLWTNQGGAQNGRAGTFVQTTQTISGSEIRSLILADLDDDGDLDALIGARLQATVWWNDGRGAFTRSTLRFRYSKKHGLAVGDFDGNGRLDIFAAAYDTAYTVWLNQGSGTFHISR